VSTRLLLYIIRHNFLTRLFDSFLDGAKNTELIRWSDRGDSFVVLDEDEFAKTLIPELFKHNNYASFVRQLNMYGFHKRVGLSDNSMKASERKNKSPSEYYNPYFKRGHPNLLWLINKPKGGGKTKPPGQAAGPLRGIVKPDPDVDSDDEGQTGIEEIYREHLPNTSRAISQAPEGGQLQKRDLALVQHQLADIQKQQAQMTNTLTRLSKENTQLFQRSMEERVMRDRHENSISAILTFLATVYNRSLDGSNPQNFAQMFGNGIPHDQHAQGNVVEIREPANQSQNPGNASPQRRQQRLLMAPPSNGNRAETVSPTSTPRSQQAFPPKSTAVEEIFDSPPETVDIKTELEQQQQQQQPDIMMNIINSTNAQNSPNVNAMQFPEMLDHYQNANGQLPLTPDQRNTMLNLIANSSSAPGTNNALVSPTPPEPPSLSGLEYTSADIERLLQAHTATGEQINSLENLMKQPLTSTSDMPILDDSQYFDGMDPTDGLNGNLDMDQFLDDGAFYGDGSPTNGTFDYGQYGNGSVGMGDSHFDMSMDGTNDLSRIIETANSSEAATPENVLDDSTGGSTRSPNKKRRRT
jgi:heat shock transcription factor